jgi:hypothetical protein
MTCTKLFESRLPLGRRVSPTRPLASGGPRGPGRSLGNGCLPGPRYKPCGTPHSTQLAGLWRLPGPSFPPRKRRTRELPAGKFGPNASPRLPPLAPANGQWSGERGGAHVSGTEDSPTGRPRRYRRVPGGVHGWATGSRAVGSGYWESIPVSAPHRPRDKCAATFVGGPAPHVPRHPPGRWRWPLHAP